MSLQVKTLKQREGYFIVSLNGRLDSQTAAEAEVKLTPLLAGVAKVVLLDMSFLDYISSMGLRVIIGAMKTIAKQKGKVAMRNAQPPIAKVFEIAGLIPSDIAASERSADIFLDAIQRREAKKTRDVSD